MKFISTRTHGALDYIVGALMIAAPWLFNFARGGAETWIFVVLGAGALLYSLFTRYELGAVKAIPMRTHLILDFMSGALLAVSPWLFSFSDYVTTPHVLFGLVETGASLFTHYPREVRSEAAHA